jgi:glutamate-1-semialdehyde aminotransferase
VGVPRELRETALPFHYNRLEELAGLVQASPEEIGVIFMEPLRGTAPEPGFLEGVREIASRIGAVLIFDEVTSGFRMNLGGIHLTLGVEPDIAVLGKALGNGFPIAAVLGRREVMDHAQRTFISSTFWTERIGFTAALATIRKMQTHPVQPEMVRFGEKINAGWRELAQKHGIPIEIHGIPPLTHLVFQVDDAQAVQTLYAQEMLARGYLLGAAVYTTYAYTDEIIANFLQDSGPVFGKIKEAIGTANVRQYLQGEVLCAGFKRLT